MRLDSVGAIDLGYVFHYEHVVAPDSLVSEENRVRTAERIEVGNYNGLARLEAGDYFDGAKAVAPVFIWRRCATRSFDTT